MLVWRYGATLSGVEHWWSLAAEPWRKDPHGARRWVNSGFIGFLAGGRFTEQTWIMTRIERDALPSVRS